MPYDLTLSLVHLDHLPQQLFHAFSFRTDRRHHRHPDHLSHLLVIESGPGTFQLVVHIQGDHTLHVHVDQLRGQVEITFQVRRVYHIDNHVGSVIHDILPDIFLLIRIS